MNGAEIMAKLEFSGRQAEILMERVGSQLSQVPEWLDEDGTPKTDRTVDFVSFLMDAAWSEGDAGTGRDRRFVNRKDRIQHRYSCNRLIYRLSLADTNFDLVVRGNEDCRKYRIGRVRGFTAILPLTAAGAYAYLDRRVKLGDLCREHILPESKERLDAQWVLLSCALHFPSILRLESYVEDIKGWDEPAILVNTVDSRSTGATIVVDLFRHLLDFFAPFYITGGKSPRVVAKDGEKETLPRIIAPITGHGMGEPILRAAGFYDIGGDKSGNSVYVFDPREIESANVDPLRRRRMAEVVKLASRTWRAKEDERDGC
jgi:hypothetical protein